MNNTNEYTTVFITASQKQLLNELRADLLSAVYVAGDSETVYREELSLDGIPGALRVISLATRRQNGTIGSYVIDARDFKPGELSHLFVTDTGLLQIFGYNANFDEIVFDTAGIPVKWWDVQLGDAVLRTGRAGITFHRPLANLAHFDLGFDIEGKGEIQTSYDARSDLTDEQVAYAAGDAVATLLGGELTLQRLDAEDQKYPDVSKLRTVADRMMGSRYWVNAMMRNGIPVAYNDYLAVTVDPLKQKLAEIEHRLAVLTGQEEPDEEEVDISSGVPVAKPKQLKPDWNPGSVADVRRILNQFAADVVKAKYGRLLTTSDSLKTNDLKMIKCPLTTALIEHRKTVKVITTYGEASLDRYVRNNRLFSRYSQGVTATGRWNSYSTNAQNFSPGLLPFLKAAPGNVLVYGDISQAELRVLAALSEDEGMISAFEDDRTDFHLATARAMFPNVDFDVLKVEDPVAFDKLRASAKSVSFGIPYGMGAQKLADDMTAKGNPQTTQSAKKLLADYRGVYPSLSAYLDARDGYITNLASALPAVDWTATIKLFKLRAAADPIVRSLKRKKGSRTLEVAGPLSVEKLVSAGLPESAVVKAMQAFGAKELTKKPTKKKLTASEQLVLKFVSDNEFGTYSSRVGNLVSAFGPDEIGDDAYHAVGLEPEAGAFRLLMRLGFSSEDLSVASKEVCGLGRYPSTKEIADVLCSDDVLKTQLAKEYGLSEDEIVAEELEANKSSLINDLEWALGFTDAVVLLEDGTPLEWYSFTPSGRRRAFNVTFGPAAKQKEDGQRASDSYSGVWINTIFELLTAATPGGLMDQFAESNNLTWPAAKEFRAFESRGEARKQVVKLLEGATGAALKMNLLDTMLYRAGLQRLAPFLNSALASCVRSAKNMYRNHAIQGSVADIVEEATARIMEALPAGTCRPILSVHDSLCLEVPEEYAAQVEALLVDSVNGAFRDFFPTVRPKTDTEIKESLAKK